MGPMARRVYECFACHRCLIPHFMLTPQLTAQPKWILLHRFFFAFFELILLFTWSGWRKNCKQKKKHQVNVWVDWNNSSNSSSISSTTNDTKFAITYLIYVLWLFHIRNVHIVCIVQYATNLAKPKDPPPLHTHTHIHTKSAKKRTRKMNVESEKKKFFFERVRKLQRLGKMYFVGFLFGWHIMYLLFNACTSLRVHYTVCCVVCRRWWRSIKKRQHCVYTTREMYSANGARLTSTTKEINLMAFSLLSTISIHYATFFLSLSRHFLHFSPFLFSLSFNFASPVSKVNFYFVICYQNAYMTYTCDHMPTLCFMCNRVFIHSTFCVFFFCIVVASGNFSLQLSPFV